MKRISILLLCFGFCGCAVNNEALVAQNNQIQGYVASPGQDALIVVKEYNDLGVLMDCQVGINSYNNPSGNTQNYQTAAPFIDRLTFAEFIKKYQETYNSLKESDRAAFMIQAETVTPMINVSCQSQEGSLIGQIYFEGKEVVHYESPSNVGIVAMTYKIPVEDFLKK